jgi:hypothetical protein
LYGALAMEFDDGGDAQRRPFLVHRPRGELQEVVNRADQAPFATRLLQAPQQELTEASSVLDLTKDRFDRLLAQAVAAAVATAGETPAHRFGSWLLPPTVDPSSTVALLAGGDIGAHLALS